MPKPVFLPPKPALRPGRPTLLNPTRQAALLNAIEQGMPLKQAAAAAGISYDTLNHWQRRGENEVEPSEYRQFCQLLLRSQAIAMQVHVSSINKAAERDWRAAAWMLERRFPTEFARPQQIEDSSSSGKPQTSSLSQDDYEVLRRIGKHEAFCSLTKDFLTILRKNRELAQEAPKLQAEAKRLQTPLPIHVKKAGIAPVRRRE